MFVYFWREILGSGIGKTCDRENEKVNKLKDQNSLQPEKWKSL